MTTYPADFCPYCGAALAARTVEGRERQFCPDCERVVWRNPVPTAGVAVVSERGVLLTERAVEPGVGEWTVPGGHLEADEHPRDAAARELAEETGVAVAPGDLTLVETDLLDPYRGKYVVNVGFAVAAADADGEPTAESDAAAVRFFPSEELDGEGYDVRPHVRDRVRAALDAV